MTTIPQPVLETKDGHELDDIHQTEKDDSITYDKYDSIYYLLYFLGRYLVVMTSYFLCIISSLYATGSLVTLEATNFFCASYTLEEIREYNLENGHQRGVGSDSCLRINRQGLNFNVLLDLNNNIFTGKIDGNLLNFVAYFQSILYFCTALILFISTLYQTYLLIYDTIYAIYSVVYNKHTNERIHKTFPITQTDTKRQSEY